MSRRFVYADNRPQCDDAIDVLRAALAQPESPQRKPLSLTDLQEALVLTNLIDRDAIDDPDNYDDGSTLSQIDELHRIIEQAHGIIESAIKEDKA